jgi:hypothetical protein
MTKLNELTREGRELLLPFEADLARVAQGIRRDGIRAIEERDLWRRVSQAVGEKITQELTVPHHLHEGACIMAAAERVRELLEGSFEVRRPEDRVKVSP